MSKTALITGITGQDGAYLAEYLLKKWQQPARSIIARCSLFLSNSIWRLPLGVSCMTPF